MKKLKIEKYDKEYFSLLLLDTDIKFSFWIDCRITDGYGYTTSIDSEETYIDWEFNKYIFHLDYSEDRFEKEYQENTENVQKIIDFLDEHEQEILNEYKEVLK